MDAELREEQQRVTRIIALIDSRLAAAGHEAGLLKEEIVDIRKRFWDDVTVNTEHPDDVIETYISMKQQAELLLQRERSHHGQARRLATLRRLKESPYFGRIDFAESGGDAERIYLGSGSLEDEGGDQFLIYDWRAPVSSLYYDYPPGPASYETPSGEIEGTLERKRQYIISGGRITSMFDTGLTIGDDLLQQVLGQGASSQMRSIVATIQQEQNRIIRYNQGKLLIVQGAAGSGKTSAALQRVAWLLYKYRGQLTADQIVLFSPNALFNSYVSAVLPELGEDNMQQTTFQEYVQHRLGDRFRLEQPFEQMEYTLRHAGDPDYAAALAGIRYKASAAFFRALLAYAKTLEQSGLVFRGLRFRGKRALSAKLISERFYSVDADLRLPLRLQRLGEWLMEQLNELERGELGKAWVQEEIELMSNEDYQKAYELLSSKHGFTEETFDDHERERRLLGRMIVRKRLRPLRQAVKALRFVDLKATYARLFQAAATPDDHSVTPGDATAKAGVIAKIAEIAETADSGQLPELWSDICAYTLGRLEQGELAHEDAAPFLLLQELIEGFRVNTSIRHVLIDEAQDYSPFQFEFLKRLFPAARFSAFGDFNQAIFAHSDDGGFETLAALFGAGDDAVLRLTRCYRSTRPIVEFTRGLVPGGEAIVPFDRDGDKPLLLLCADRAAAEAAIAARIGALRGEGFASIAVIGKTADECAAAYEALRARVPGLQLVADEADGFGGGVCCIPSYLAKGIEFDAVLVSDASDNAYSRQSERRLFYTVCTRAMHRLYLYSVGRPTPLLEAAAADTYIKVTV